MDRLGSPEQAVPDRRGGDAPRRGDAPPSAPPDDPDLTYWQQVERFDALWERHVARWPGAPGKTAQDRARPDDPAGCWRGAGGRYLSPEQNAEADEAIGWLRAPEREVTAVLLAVQQDNAHGARLEGLDHRLKGVQRLKEKIADALAAEPGSSVADVVAEIDDAVRYTYSCEPQNYTRGWEEVAQRLEAAGYRAFYRENHWLHDSEYKGINTRWQTPDGGTFELQFHTLESFDAKENRTHCSYERLRLPTTDRPEQRALHRYQRVVSTAIVVPDGALGIASMRKTKR